MIATSRLPYLSAEPHHDGEVQQIIGETFGISTTDLASGKVPIQKGKGYHLNGNGSGGKAYFLPKAEASLLNSVLQESIPVRDVEIHEAPRPLKRATNYDGALTYIHKLKNGRASHLHLLCINREFFPHEESRLSRAFPFLCGDNTQPP